MKKNFFYFALCAIALPACTSEEVIEESVFANAIGFENVINKQSKAGENAVDGDLTKDNFDQFMVYGYYTKDNLSGHPVQVFGGDPVTFNKGSKKWEYTNTRYWIPDATYYFYAYSCGDVSLNNSFGTPGIDMKALSQDSRELKISQYVCDRRHQHDLITARAEDRKGQEKGKNSTVSFTFNHALTKVNACFQSQFAGDYDVEVSEVELENFCNVGNYSISKGWTDVVRVPENETTPIYLRLGFNGSNVCSAKTDKKAEVTATTSSVYVIPYAYQTANVQLKFRITVKQDGDVVMSRSMVGTWRPTWLIGYRYTYNIHISGTAASLDAIAFEVAEDPITGWTNGTGSATDMSFSGN